MYPRSGAVLGYAILVWIGAAGPLPSADRASQSADYYQARLDRITIPRLIWKQVKQGDAFDEWSKLVRQCDESGQGIPLSVTTTLAGETVFNESAWDVSARELLAHICVRLRVQFRVTDQGVQVVNSKHPYSSRPSAELQPEATRELTIPDWLIRNAKESAQFVTPGGPTSWREHIAATLTRGFPDDSEPTLQWMEDGKTIRARADPQILDGIAELMDQRIHRPPLALNAGEQRLLAQFAPWEYVRLPEISIDAPSIRDALDKLLAIVGRTPGGEQLKVEWKFSDARLAEAGPVHYQYPSDQLRATNPSAEPIPASRALVETLATCGGTLRGNEDGRWEIARSRLGEQTGLISLQYKVPPEVLKTTFDDDDPNGKARKDPKARTPGCGGTVIGPGNFVIYSPASNTLIIKDTIIGQLRWRRTLIEKWPKPQPAEAKKKQNAKKR